MSAILSAGSGRVINISVLRVPVLAVLNLTVIDVRDPSIYIAPSFKMV